MLQPSNPPLYQDYSELMRTSPFTAHAHGPGLAREEEHHREQLYDDTSKRKDTYKSSRVMVKPSNPPLCHDYTELVCNSPFTAAPGPGLARKEEHRREQLSDTPKMKDTYKSTRIMVEPSNPPLYHDYAELVCTSPFTAPPGPGLAQKEEHLPEELPLIDLGRLRGDGGEKERLECVEAIARASSEWGFFQVVNHGVRGELFDRMRSEQMKLFQAPFEKKVISGLLNSSYKWGNPTATSPTQFNWSEAFHIPLTKISEESCYGDFKSLREVMIEYASAMQELSKLLGGVLMENLGHRKNKIKQLCDENTCFLRLNHYPPCKISPEVFGLVPHTDSDFLTILHQDQVGGLQLMKDSRWVAVKPIKNALIVNIGDLFQAWSNDIYKSVEHKVMPNGKVDRFSIAYFLCPSYDSVIGSCQQPSIYRNFTFGEYRNQIQQDVKFTGHKVGLSRFLH